MASKVWDGSDSNFRNGKHWTPAGAPGSGDTAIIGAGTVHASGVDISSVSIDIGSEQPVNDPKLALRDVVLGDVTVHGPSGPNFGAHPTLYADLTVSGLVVDKGTLAVGETDPTGAGVPGDVEVDLANSARFVLTGRILEQTASSFTVSGQAHSSFVNDGSFTDIGGSAKILDSRHRLRVVRGQPGQVHGRQLDFRERRLSGRARHRSRGWSSQSREASAVPWLNHR